MTASIMRERVARAIADAAGDDYYEDMKYWERIAVSALTEMREPTDRMIWDGGTAMHDANESSTGVYQAFIDAALAEI